MRSINGYNLTPEQNVIVELAINDLNIKGEAGAGSGKTSTLKAVDKYKSKMGKRAYYICFNKALEQEAKGSFSKFVNVTTANALAYKHICTQDTNWKLKLNRRILTDEVIKYAQVDRNRIPLLKILDVSKAITKTVDNFCSSASSELSAVHVCDEVLKIHNKDSKKNEHGIGKLEFIDYIVKHSNLFLKPFFDNNSDCPATHSAYLKKWQLSKPIINTDYIMYDEGQDANPVILSVILQQKCQKIICGDRYQSIYAFNNAVNAMDLVPYVSCPIQTSFRYSQELADLANKIIRLIPIKSDFHLIGKGHKTEIIKASKYNQSERAMIIARTNATLFELMLCVLEANVPTFLAINDLDAQVRLIKQLLLFESGKNVKLPPYLAIYKCWDDLVSSEHLDSDVSRIAKLIDENPSRAQNLITAIEANRNVRIEQAFYILTTAHKSKGLECDNVFVCDDFDAVLAPLIDPDEEVDQEELHLLYVAITRAKKKLILSDTMYDLLHSAGYKPKVRLTPTKAFSLDGINEQVIELRNQEQLQPGLIADIKDKALAPYRNIAKNEASEAISARENIQQGKAHLNANSAIQGDIEPIIGDETLDFSDLDVLIEQNWHVPSGCDPKIKDKIYKNLIKRINSKINSGHIKQALNNSLPTKGFLSVNVGRVYNNASMTIPADPKNIQQDELINLDIEIPLFWTPLDSSRFENPNLAILGTMGTGKTQLVKAILYEITRQRHLNGGQSLGLLIFDYKQDFCDEEFVKKTNATVLTPHHLPINPFAIFKKEKMATLKTAEIFVNTLVKIFRIGGKQQRCIRNIILQCYESFGLKKNDVSTFNNRPPTIYDVYQLYCMQEKVPDDLVISALDTLVDYEIFTDNPEASSLLELLKDNVVVINLKGYADTQQSFIVSLLLDSFYQQMHLAGKPQIIKGHRPLTNMLLVDECDNLMKHEPDALKKILKEGREFGVGCILSTQGLDHFKVGETNYADYFLAWICHKLGSPSTKALEQIFNLTDRESIKQIVARMNSQNKHHSIFVDAKKNFQFQRSSAFWEICEREKKSAQERIK
ncbi:AAA family ATPase [Photobacterium damselae]|nr:AAA family ATPase [Photobacterium damselae]